MIDIQKKLDDVIQQNKQKQQAIKTIRSTTHKKVGMTYLEISPDEKEKMLNKIQKFYDSKINGIYQNINSQLQEAGQSPLTSPFMKMNKSISIVVSERFVKRLPAIAGIVFVTMVVKMIFI